MADTRQQWLEAWVVEMEKILYKILRRMKSAKEEFPFLKIKHGVHKKKGSLERNGERWKKRE